MGSRAFNPMTSPIYPVAKSGHVRPPAGHVASWISRKQRTVTIWSLLPDGVRVACTFALPAMSWEHSRLKPPRAAPPNTSEAIPMEVPKDWHVPDSWKDWLENLSSPSASSDFIQECVARIRQMFASMGDGDISVSPYDTAWVAMVPALDGSKGPQFPDSLTWVAESQLSDGSWSEAGVFSAYDRVINTLGCVVALQTWGTAAESVARGCDYITSNIHKIEEEAEDHLPIGFEIVFPKMMEMGQGLGLNLPYDSPICQRMQLERERKLKKIPMEMLHTQTTSLSFSLEGLHDVLDWERMMKLQAPDGSFMTSPASTACALMHTGDQNCLHYLNSVLQKFNNAVPNMYPVDMSERCWMVDRLERLGIARYFQDEIKVCLDHVYKHWTPAGMAWSRNVALTDVNETAMGFRLLRLRGYDTSPDVFLPFHNNDQFFCLERQKSDSVTAMFNMYRASQTLFPGETLLEEAMSFCTNFLRHKLQNNAGADKWVMVKDLHGEVECGLAFPWYASLPRIDIRAYLDHYGPNDVWIGKCLYRMHNVHNPTFLALAKADFNMCQAQHQQEMEYLATWNKQQGFEELSFARQKVVEVFFAAAATMFAPELGRARIAWAQNAVLAIIVDDYFDLSTSMQELRQFKAAIDSWDPSLIDHNNRAQRIVFMGIYNTVNATAAEASEAQGRDVRSRLVGLHKRLVGAAFTESVWAAQRIFPHWDEYMATAEPSFALECITVPAMFLQGEQLSEDVLEGDEFKRLTKTTNVIGRVLNDIQGYKREALAGKANSVSINMRAHPHKTEEEICSDLRKMVDTKMQELASLVLCKSQVPQSVKEIFFHMARSNQLFYKDGDGVSSISAMKEHVKKILFEPVRI